MCAFPIACHLFTAIINTAINEEHESIRNCYC